MQCDSQNYFHERMDRSMRINSTDHFVLMTYLEFKICWERKNVFVISRVHWFRVVLRDIVVVWVRHEAWMRFLSQHWSSKSFTCLRSACLSVRLIIYGRRIELVNLPRFIIPFCWRWRQHYFAKNIFELLKVCWNQKLMFKARRSFVSFSALLIKFYFFIWWLMFLLL
jgi:hypothetical protein